MCLTLLTQQGMETGFSEIESSTLTLILSTRSHFDTVVFSMSEERFSVNQSTNEDLRVKDQWSTKAYSQIKTSQFFADSPSLPTPFLLSKAEEEALALPLPKPAKIAL